VVFMAFAMLLSPASPIRAATLQEKFDALCINTQDAESLPLEKLQALVAECDKLKEAIEQSSDPKKKVLLFRLKKCRNFLAFIVETKQNPSAGSSK
jgi:hypothetical protein